MNTDQARRLVALHDNYDRALGNLRNANAMSSDDPRATELLEEAGDAYAGALAALVSDQEVVTHPLLKARITFDPDAQVNELEDALTKRLVGPADAPSAPETPSEDSGEGQGAKEG